MSSFVLKTTFQKLQPQEIIYRNFKNIELNKFKNDIRTKAQSADNYETLEKEFLEALNKHVPSKKSLLEYIMFLSDKVTS